MFWTDDRPQCACCLFAEDEALETDPEAYDCETCRVADALDTLWPENRRAWTLYRTLLTRFTFDTGAVAMLLDRVTRDLEPDDLCDLVERLSVMFDVMNPAPAVPTET